MSQKFKYAEQEKVFCYHGPMLYEAKIVKVDSAKADAPYVVHYQGWSKTWDEAVGETRLLKFNDEHIKLAEQIKQDSKKGSSKKGKKKSLGTPGPGESSPKPGGSTSGSVKDGPTSGKSSVASKSGSVSAAGGGPGSVSGSVGGGDRGEGTSTPVTTSERPKRSKTVKTEKPSTEPFVESEESFLNRPEIKIKIPDELKPFLVDDWDYVTRQKKLVKIPVKSEITVDSLLEDFCRNYKAKNKGLTKAKESQLDDFCNGVKEYFNIMLGTRLLYKFERPQYSDLLVELKKQSEAGAKTTESSSSAGAGTGTGSSSATDGSTLTAPSSGSDPPEETDKIPPMSSQYGGIHFMRFMTQFGSFLAQTNIDEKSAQLIVSFCNELLKFIARLQIGYLSAEQYQNSTPDYQRRGMC